MLVFDFYVLQHILLLRAYAKPNAIVRDVIRFGIVPQMK